jgi:hypothetical protein
MTSILPDVGVMECILVAIASTVLTMTITYVLLRLVFPRILNAIISRLVDV